MKLTPESASNLQRLLATCNVAGIDSIIVEECPVNGLTVRGVNDDKSCVILADASHNPPYFRKDIKNETTRIVMGLSRLSVLNERIALFKDDPLAVVNLKENDKGEISSLDISSPIAKVQFRCTASALIRAPKKIMDTEKFALEIDREQIKFILLGAKSMSSKRAVIVSKNDGTFFEFSDSNQDTFSVRVADAFPEVFAHHLPTTIFLPLLKATINNEGPIVLTIGEIGTIGFVINEFPLIILPQLQE